MNKIDSQSYKAVYTARRMDDPYISVCTFYFFNSHGVGNICIVENDRWLGNKIGDFTTKEEFLTECKKWMLKTYGDFANVQRSSVSPIDYDDIDAEIKTYKV